MVRVLMGAMSVGRTIRRRRKKARRMTLASQRAFGLGNRRR